MRNKTIFLYANKPVIRHGESYYVKSKSFLDFMADLAKLNGVYRLMFPCKVLTRLSAETLISINLPDGVIEGSYCVPTKHLQAFVASFVNAFRIRSQVLKAVKKGDVILAGPGPNSFLFWLSLITPKSVRFAFFIRGDTLKTIHYIYSGRFLYPIATGLVRLFRRRIHNLVSQGRARVFLFGDKLVEQYPGPESVIHVISPLIESTFVRSNIRPDIPEGRPLKVLYVGRFSEEKNILALIDACALATKEKKPFTLGMVGFGPLEAALRKHILELGVSNQVKLLGYIPHGDALIAEFDRHDLFCLPSYTEGTPGVVVEAFARGMPVLATPVGSLPSLFPKEIRFFNGFDAKEISEGIDWCDSHRVEFSAMGRMGQKATPPFLIHENAIWVDKILRSSM